jgi:S-(hydroxymethyl)glutathione dehydrogenase/alcohol dehydrogenase
MQAIVLHRLSEPLVVEDVDLDDPREGEVQVRMVASGVCHSCLYFANGSRGEIPLPMVLGDEGAGVVEAVGRGVSRLKVGDHVILSWAPSCGRCHYCVTGKPVLCEEQGQLGFMPDGSVRMRLRGRSVHHFGPATYASAIVVPENGVVKIRSDMPLDKAALIGCSVMTGLGAVVNTARVSVGESLAVFGCGGVGLNAIQGGRLVCAYPIVAVDIAARKLEFAQTMGATHVFDASREDAAAAIRRLTRRGVQYAVAAAGDVRAIEQAWKSLAPGGTCVVVGVPPRGQMISIDPYTLVIGEERRLVGSSYGSARIFEDFPRLVDLYLGGKLQIDELITKRYEMGEANEAFRALEAGENARGLIVF